MTKAQKIPAQKIILHVILSIGGIFMVIPFLWMILTSMKSMGEAMSVPPVIFPTEWKYMNYVEVFRTFHFGVYYINTTIVALAKTISQLFICSIGAYAFAKMEFPGKNFLFIMILASLMLPHQVTLIPSFILIRYLGWLNTFSALVIPGIFSAFGIFLLRQFFLSIPKELDDAGKIDGASYFRIYWNIALPLAKPGLISLAIFTVIASWNDFLWPLIVTNTDKMRMISIGISSFVGQHSTDYPLLMAAGVLATLPMIVVFIFLQRHFIEGITLSGIKG